MHMLGNKNTCTKYLTDRFSQLRSLLNGLYNYAAYLPQGGVIHEPYVMPQKYR